MMDIPVELQAFFQKHKRFLRQVFTIRGAVVGLGSVLIVVGAVAAIYLSKNNQDIRQQASMLVEVGVMQKPSLSGAAAPGPVLPPEFSRVVGVSGDFCYCAKKSDGSYHYCDVSLCCHDPNNPSAQNLAVCKNPPKPIPPEGPPVIPADQTDLDPLTGKPIGSHYGPIDARGGACYCKDKNGNNYVCSNPNLCCQDASYKSFHPECSAPQQPAAPIVQQPITPQQSTAPAPPSVIVPQLLVQVTCGGGGSCQKGSCSSDQAAKVGDCPPEKPYCCVGGGSVTSPSYFNAMTDSAHCGANEIVCNSEQTCVNGACVAKVVQPLPPMNCQTSRDQICSTGWVSAQQQCPNVPACAGTITQQTLPIPQATQCYSMTDACSQPSICSQSYVFLDANNCNTALKAALVSTQDTCTRQNGSCQSGSCSTRDQTTIFGAVCPSNQYCCAGGGNTGINTRTDVSNCGFINRRCDVGQVCDAGQCATPAAATQPTNVSGVKEITGSESSLGKNIYITVDAVTNVSNMTDMYNTLNKRGLKATIFPSTGNLDVNDPTTQKLFRDMYKSGFQFGYDTVYHQSGLTSDQLTTDYQKWKSDMSTLLGADFTPKLARAPQGDFNKTWQDFTHNNGMTDVHWTYNPAANDSQSNYDQSVTNNNGATIILLHTFSSDRDWLKNHLDQLVGISGQKGGTVTNFDNTAAVGKTTGTTNVTTVPVSGVDSSVTTGGLNTTNLDTQTVYNNYSRAGVSIADGGCGPSNVSNIAKMFGITCIPNIGPPDQCVPMNPENIVKYVYDNDAVRKQFEKTDSNGHPVQYHGGLVCSSSGCGSGEIDNMIVLHYLGVNNDQLFKGQAYSINGQGPSYNGDTQANDPQNVQNAVNNNKPVFADVNIFGAGHYVTLIKCPGGTTTDVCGYDTYFTQDGKKNTTGVPQLINYSKIPHATIFSAYVTSKPSH